MKKLLVLLIVLTGLAALPAATLINETFSSPPNFPAGWAAQAPIGATGAWTVSTTDYANGSPGELKLNYNPPAIGTFRFISPPIDTRKVHDMTLSFNHYIDNYSNSSPHSVGVQISNDLVNWTYLWVFENIDSDWGEYPRTLSIPYSQGMSQTTYIAFTFAGNNYDLEFWCIDNVQLTYTNTLGSGTWSPGTYYPVGDLIIPHGHTLTLQPGTTINFGSDKQLTMRGRLLAMGSAAQPITFTTPQIRQNWRGINFENVNTANDSTIIENSVIEYASQSGIYLLNSSKVRVSNSHIRFNLGNIGAGIYFSQSSAVIDNCDIYENTSGSTTGSGVAVFNAAPVIRQSRIYHNTSPGSFGSAVYLSQCNVSGIYNNQISANYTGAGGYAVRTYLATGTFLRNLVSNNAALGMYVNGGPITILNCDIVYNGEIGYYNYSNTAVLKNTIIWGNTGVAVYNYQPFDHIYISYCCFPAGSTTNVITTDITNYINDDPEFVRAALAAGTAGFSGTNDWSLSFPSPCIDAADPASPLNPDGSREDIGKFYRQKRPIITSAVDFPNDQGHKIDLIWQSSDIDNVYDPMAFYGIWRSGYSRSEEISEPAVIITNPADLTSALLNSGREIILRDGDRTWYWLNIRVPATLYDSYGMLIDTPQDSSSTGTHACDYKVTFYNAVYFYESVPVSAYSVDNIPPYVPSRPEIARTGTNTYTLSWDEVTEGCWEGNSYPEVNPITYKVYASDTCDFVPGPANFLLSTTGPYVVLLNQTADHKFFKITASDSE